MELEDFRRDFLSQVRLWAAADLNFRHSAFVEVAIRLLEDAGEVADFEPSYYRGTGSRRRTLAIDGYAFDEADGSARLFVADPSLNDETPTLTQTEARASFGRLRAFVEDAMAGRLSADLEESSPEHGLASELLRRRSALARIRAYVLTDALLSLRARDWPEGDIDGVPVEFHVWDIARFHRAHESRTGRDELVIDFGAIAAGGLPCLKAGTDSEDYSAYLCVVPGTILADIYDTYGSRLLEGNVRAFLSTKGRINKGIRATVLNEAEMFFAYNNGIAATASSIRVEEDSAGLRLVSATDLQIVNGGQTTASLAAARRQEQADLARTFVPMKLSVVSPERSGEMIPLISRYANSQNKVSDADFFSNHEYHRRLEQISRRLWAPAKPGVQHETRWFYERARGQYLNEPAAFGAADRRRFLEMNPRDQVITKTDIAKGENVWRRLPHIVSRGAQKNFLDFAGFITDRWNASTDEFNEDYFRAAVAKVLLFRATERLVSAQPWYSGGYRANVVAYAIAKLVHHVVVTFEGKQIDLIAIWQRQGLSETLTAQIAISAEAMHHVITMPPPGVQNVTEWSKKELCWERAKQAPLAIVDGLEGHLTEISEVRAQRQAARSQQRQDSRIDAQSAVVRLGRDYWRSLRDWGTQRRLVPPEDDRLLRVAAGIVQGLPSDRQCVKLLLIKERLEGEGFARVAIPA
jgi:hypothetical protein